MLTTNDRRIRKRMATRQAISDAATQLFNERGFDQVTVDDIAAAADVGRKTVFNHFARKEDMFFDLDDQARDELCAALRGRDADTSPLEALRLFAHASVAQRKPYLRFFAGSVQFMNTIEASDALRARARAIRDELVTVVKVALADAAGEDHGDPDADLAATLLVAGWALAFIRAQQTVRHNADEGEAQKVFLALVDRTAVGLEAALAATPYA